MEIRTFDVDGLLEIVPAKIVDERGYFAETFRAERFREHAGEQERYSGNEP